MTTGKKKRMSILDSLAAAGAPSPTAATSMMSSNRALRSARDAVDGHRVWELDPASVIDGRLADRLDPTDVADLRDAIEANGQAVPILVRRHPTEADQYLLVYGRRRLEAIRSSGKVTKVRALVAAMDDDTAVRTQISENMARRDLSYIEKAVFAQELIQNGFGTQAQVAEVLTVTKSSVSMSLAIVEMVGSDLIRAIGPAVGVGRPRWDALGHQIMESGVDVGILIAAAEEVHTKASVDAVVEGAGFDPTTVSVAAFEAVEKTLAQTLSATGRKTAPATHARPKTQVLTLGEVASGTVKKTAKGVSITLDSGPFADWVQGQAQEVIQDLHRRWQQSREDT